MKYHRLLLPDGKPKKPKIVNALFNYLLRRRIRTVHTLRLSFTLLCKYEISFSLNIGLEIYGNKNYIFFKHTMYFNGKHSNCYELKIINYI